MKFIHLSDLHLGKRVNEYSMLEDQEYPCSHLRRWMFSPVAFTSILGYVGVLSIDTPLLLKFHASFSMSC